jgi:hypothetical protein
MHSYLYGQGRARTGLASMHVNSGSADRGHLTIREQKTISEEAVRFLFSLLREYQAEVPEFGASGTAHRRCDAGDMNPAVGFSKGINCRLLSAG